MRLAGIQCDCGEPDLFSVAPGTEAKEFDDLFTVQRGVPLRAWCPACATKAGFVGGGEPGEQGICS